MDDIEKLVKLYSTPRSNRLNELKLWVDTKQYLGRPNWWDPTRPMIERAPLIAHKSISAAIKSNVSLVFGEGRFPEITVDLSEAEATSEGSDGAQREDQKAIHAFILKALKKSGGKKAIKRAFEFGQEIGTSALFFSVDRRGRVKVTADRATWMTPIYSEEGDLEQVAIQYPYVIEQFDALEKKWRQKVMIYRRVIDQRSDTVYFPAEANDEGLPPVWKENPKKTIKHGLGFCPVVWFRFNAESDSPADIDGIALHADCHDEVEAYDRALSARDRAALFASGPIFTATGVSKGSFAATGRTARVDARGNPIDGHFSIDSHGNKVIDFINSSPPEAPAMKVGPGELWTSENADAKFGQVSIEGNALNPISENAADIRSKLSESLGVVAMDPESIKFAATVSGKALAIVMKRQLDRCDNYRDDLEDTLLTPTLQMLMRIICKRVDLVSRVMPSLEAVSGELSKLFDSDSPSGFEFKWGPYFTPDSADRKQEIETIAAAKRDGLVSNQSAVKMVSSIFSLDAQAELDAIEETEQDTEGKLDSEQEMPNLRESGEVDSADV